MDEGLTADVDGHLTSRHGLSLFSALDRGFRLRKKRKTGIGEGHEVLGRRLLDSWFFVWFMSRFLTAFFDHDMKI